MHESTLPEWTLDCPYCDATIEVLVDTSQGSHETWEDCSQCCAPIHFRIEVDPVTEEILSVVAGDDDEVI
ncbi:MULTISPECIES: CPXCG motif-containing cysteine-rich protein [Halomonas]|uniref:CPXCG motif-containing cysteine-rich protein n=1 Tax=Halomonas TaxID=2745 RepID=UPI001A90A52F|nr:MULTISPECIES: CPXCG motif-containing cysteine-rich protein [Halomonas]MED5297391.1 CPXCG motif-containing cysteine-rich protein [Pseudomonadota bacterium]MBN8411848.1 CPXCG motif-containing cysteine-rich protein [Halomonas litopenaei]MBY5923641.1 CPXCG motif-containing cysteine-rich protein [Halomonas sp. DP4Y7-2]MBY5927788.1 CPXCG motif-containing cysteine-rich protein [Halomonas sp. DP8Y7-3]MBY5967661.1 CPXCG motif-containing cysteine-rich protein [Halomonas denitrificans]